VNENQDTLQAPPPAVDPLDRPARHASRAGERSKASFVLAQWFRDSISGLFSLDLRSLGLFRIGLGAILLIDAVRRWFLAEAFYSDSGVFPRSLNLEMLQRNYWSLHLATGTVWGEGILFGASILSALALLVGFRTRLATALSFLLLLSLHNRNGFIINGGDSLLRQLLFWGLFLPLGARFSLDRTLAERTDPNPLRGLKSVCSVGTAALTLQVFLVYFCAACEKTSPMWRSDGTAVYYAFHLGFFATSFAGYFLQYPTLLKWLTELTILLEYFGPFLLFVPVGRVPCRIMAVALFWFFHSGIGLAFNIKTFAAVSIISWLALVPGVVWDRLIPRTRAARRLLGDLWRKAKAHSLAVLAFRRFQPLFGARLRGERLHLRSSVLGSIAAGVLFLAILSVLIRGLKLPILQDYSPSWLDGLCATLRLDENWSMFAPDIPQSSGWYVAVAKLRSGQEVDLRRSGASVAWDRPPTVSDTYETVEWANYCAYLQADRYVRYRPYYAAFVCRKWNETHDPAKQVNTLKLYYMRENTPPPGAVAEHPIEKILLLTYHPASLR
jgi:hypothetical protein